MVWYWYEDRFINQRERIKSPEISTHIYGQLTFDKAANSMEKEEFFQWRLREQLDTLRLSTFLKTLHKI